MEEKPENNELLLNAIKRKFGACKQDGPATFSIPEFKLPSLKIPQNEHCNANITNINALGNENNSPKDASSSGVSNLNNFLMKQLREKSTDEKNISKCFIVPQLKRSTNSNQEDNRVQVVTPLLQNLRIGTDDINKNITSQICDRKHMDTDTQSESGHSSRNIDLTSALSTPKEVDKTSSSTRTAPLPRPTIKPQINFDIPFIECDRKEIKQNIDDADYHSETNYPRLKRSTRRPSLFAQIFCLKYINTNPIPNLDHTFRVKYRIERFKFDTKSPDETFISAAEKNNNKKFY